jgi:microcin C transport system substrate-binding protein
MFDSLLTGSLDETAARATDCWHEDVAGGPDGMSATFRLRPEARFHNGKPVLAADVKHSYDTLVGPHTSPAYKTLLIDVAGVDVLGERTVRYRFHKPNRELPLTVGGLPVFSRDWGVENGQAKPFDQVVMDVPIGSGPYRVGPVRFGKDITYVRDPDYWARDLNVRKGTANFDRITVKIYKDNTARLEALKAGEFDLMRFFSAGDWARRVNGRKFDTGELVKGEFAHKLPSGYQSYVLNTRRPFLQDVRVREALGLALDYEWMNRQMFYGAYQRVNGLFGNTACETRGTPSPQELELMEPLRKHIPPAAFGPMTVPPRTDGDSSLRANLRRAQQPVERGGLGSARWRPAQCPGPGHGARIHGQQRGWRARGHALDAQPGKTGHQLALPRGGLRPVPAAPAEVRLRHHLHRPSRARTTLARSSPTCSAARRQTPRIRATLPA